MLNTGGDAGPVALWIAMGLGAAVFGAGLTGWAVTPYALAAVLLGGALQATALAELQSLGPRAGGPAARLTRLAWIALWMVLGALVVAAARAVLAP